MTDFLLTEQQINEGIERCRRRVESLLRDAELIIPHVNNSKNAVGLYTIAIEECGKLLLLKDCLNSQPNPDGTRVVTGDIFGRGRGRHPTIKFDRILPNLPDPCKKIGNIVGGFSSSFSDGFQKTKQDILTNFQTRKDIFYVDWDDTAGKWSDGLDIESKDLKVAIDQFRNWIKSNL